MVTNNDVVALGVLDGARERGLAVPDELAVIGFDDIDVAGLLRPALTTVRIPASEEGGAAAELLLSRLREDVVRPPRAVTFSTEVVRRESA
ncbi:hypothetical protein GCM10025864_14300 [Luteimicrobium album]|uniref:Transcriptional regulator LacI/GalR-like sensor domain-containing protein n=1 Tax=Luteimicrobium album TaxID=1054550 RepID=A0ABQ6I097_9MICO|nr:hypothetical protein GCM10025864_14300 [Luteimicrobium album]